jgi:hypothetical protein
MILNTLWTSGHGLEAFQLFLNRSETKKEKKIKINTHMIKIEGEGERIKNEMDHSPS